MEEGSSLGVKKTLIHLIMEVPMVTGYPEKLLIYF